MSDGLSNGAIGKEGGPLGIAPYSVFMGFGPITPSNGSCLGAGWEGRGRPRLGREMGGRLVDQGFEIEVSIRALLSSEELEDGGMGRTGCWVTVS